MSLPAIPADDVAPVELKENTTFLNAIAQIMIPPWLVCAVCGKRYDPATNAYGSCRVHGMDDTKYSIETPKRRVLRIGDKSTNFLTGTYHPFSGQVIDDTSGVPVRACCHSLPDEPGCWIGMHSPLPFWLPDVDSPADLFRPTPPHIYCWKFQPGHVAATHMLHFDDLVRDLNSYATYLSAIFGKRNNGIIGYDGRTKFDEKHWEDTVKTMVTADINSHVNKTKANHLADCAAYLRYVHARYQTEEVFAILNSKPEDQFQLLVKAAGPTARNLIFYTGTASDEVLKAADAIDLKLKTASAPTLSIAPTAAGSTTF